MQNQIEARSDFTVEVLSDPKALWALENQFLTEIGEKPLDKARQDRLETAMKDKQIIFFVAKRLNQPIGICSVSACFSTFACNISGVFDDFYVAPGFRRQGVARLLVSAAQGWCQAHGYASLTVGCSACDIPMYRSLGFETELGAMLAANL